MSEFWVVKKFGGTSVANASQWRAIAGLVAAERSLKRRVLVVCSALSGVTDQLLLLANDEAQRDETLDSIRHRHEALARELGVRKDAWLDAGLQKIEDALAQPDGLPRTAAVLAMGEWLSSRLGEAVLADTDHPATWVDAREALEVVPEPDRGSNRAWMNARCSAGAMPELERRWSGLGTVLITQGYVARSPDGRTALLGRSGSDTSAALLATRLGAERVEIWTDVPGLFTADPRTEPLAQRVEALSFEEALEMAASGARVIHGRCIRAAAAAGIPVDIRTLLDPAAPGTRISGEPPPEHGGARAITSQENMLVLLLRNLDTRQQVGFLARVFAVISGAGFSVDQVATSETTTTLAIDASANHLEDEDVRALVGALEAYCEVQTFPDSVCVSVVGRNARLALHGLASAQKFFEHHRLLMMSHSAADRSISLLVDREGATELARMLHRELVTNVQKTGAGQ